METSTVAAEQLTSQVRKVVDWYTGGFLTEEEFLYLLERSIHPSPSQGYSVNHSEATWR